MIKKFIISSKDKRASLKEFSPENAGELSENDIKDKYKKLQEKFTGLQEVFYASKKYGLLIIL